MMTKQILEDLRQASKVYNDQRMHRDFQAAEVEKFIKWLYEQYGYEYKE